MQNVKSLKKIIRSSEIEYKLVNTKFCKIKYCTSFPICIMYL